MIYPYLLELKYNFNFGKSPYNKQLRDWILSISVEKKNIFLASKEFEVCVNCFDSGPVDEIEEEFRHHCNCGVVIRYKFQIRNKITGKIYPEGELEKPRVKALGCVCIKTFLPDETSKVQKILERVKKHYDLFNRPYLYCLVCKNKMNDGVCLKCAKKLIKEAKERKKKINQRQE